jgi:FkbM family methyltransferase
MFRKQSTFERLIKRVFHKLINKIDNNGNADFYKNGEYWFLQHLIQRYKDLKDTPLLIMDIGANIGNYSNLIVQKAINENISLDLHVFEPTKACFEELDNKLVSSESNISIHKNNIGLSSESGKAKIFFNEPKSGLASLYQRNLEYYDVKMDQYEVITLQRMDDYIDRQLIDHIHFIKIDIEGHELNAFKGFGSYLNSSFIDFIQFEYGGANLDSHTSLKDFFSLFEESGFKVAKVMPTSLQLRSYEPSMDNFEYANYVAISKAVL